MTMVPYHRAMTQPEGAKIRKQVYLLTAQDFVDHPIWEFCLDEESVEGQDEATVRPTDEIEVEGYSDGMYVVAADATLSDGTVLPAYLYTGEPNNVGGIQPNLIVEAGQVNIWYGWLRIFKNPEGYVADCLSRLSRPREAIFPVKFETRAKINGGRLSVTIDGFKALSPDRQLTTIG